jgi:hypothetical protein
MVNNSNNNNNNIPRIWIGPNRKGHPGDSRITTKTIKHLPPKIIWKRIFKQDTSDMISSTCLGINKVINRLKPCLTDDNMKMAYIEEIKKDLGEKHLSRFFIENNPNKIDVSIQFTQLLINLGEFIISSKLGTASSIFLCKNLIRENTEIIFYV